MDHTSPGRPAAGVTTLDGAFRRIPINLIDPGTNHRGDVGDVTELAATLKAVGQLQPVTVAEAPGGRYRLIDGHRRRKAAPLAGLQFLDAVVRRAPDDASLAVKQLAIQGHSRRFNPMAEARALHELMFERNMTRDAIAVAVGKTPAWVRDRIALVHLEPGEQRQVADGRMSVAEATLRLKNRRELREGRSPVAAKTTGPGRQTVPRTTPASARRTVPRTTPPNATAAAAGLTALQLQALTLLADGRTQAEIGAAMDVSPATVRSHLDKAFDLLGAINAVHAVHLAYQRGVLRAACEHCDAGQAAAR